MKWLILIAVLVWALPAHAIDGQRYGEVRLAEPSGGMRGFVIYFSDRGGWKDGDQAIIDRLAAKGALTVGVDTDTYLARIAPGDEKCDQLVGDAETLSRDLQHGHGDIEYQFPILIGTGQGGTLAGVTLAQAPANTLSGAISINPAEWLVSKRPLCPRRVAVADGKGGFAYGPVTTLDGFWTVATTPAFPAAERTFLGTLAKAGMPFEVQRLTGPATGEAVADLVEPHLFQGSDGGVASLPLVELPADKPSPLMAVVISGDGGWRDIDKTLAEKLQQDGVSVVGWDSVRYFWHRKSPAQTAADLAAVIETYGTKWHAGKVALVGYSFGADVMPFLYNLLPKPLRDRVVLVSLLGFEANADWEITVAGWLGARPSGESPPVMPEIDRMPASILQCFYGQDEDDSVCPQLAPLGVEIIKTTGGHHFDGDYSALEQKILSAFRQKAGS